MRLEEAKINSGSGRCGLTTEMIIYLKCFVGCLSTRKIYLLMTFQTMKSKERKTFLWRVDLLRDYYFLICYSCLGFCSNYYEFRSIDIIFLWLPFVLDLLSPLISEGFLFVVVVYLYSLLSFIAFIWGAFAMLLFRLYIYKSLYLLCIHKLSGHYWVSHANWSLFNMNWKSKFKLLEYPPLTFGNPFPVTRQ